eukprot:284816445_4
MSSDLHRIPVTSFGVTDEIVSSIGASEVRRNFFIDESWPGSSLHRWRLLFVCTRICKTIGSSTTFHGENGMQLCGGLLAAAIDSRALDTHRPKKLLALFKRDPLRLRPHVPRYCQVRGRPKPIYIANADFLIYTKTRNGTCFHGTQLTSMHLCISGLLAKRNGHPNLFLRRILLKLISCLMGASTWKQMNRTDMNNNHKCGCCVTLRRFQRIFGSLLAANWMTCGRAQLPCLASFSPMTSHHPGNSSRRSMLWL